MYFWKMRQLSFELVNNHIDEKEKFKYFAIHLFVGSVLSSLTVMRFVISVTGPYYYWLDICSISAFILGVFLAKKYNDKFDGLNFLDRYICLSVPLFLRGFAFGGLAGILQGIAIFVFKSDELSAYLDLFSQVAVSFYLTIILVNEFRTFEKLRLIE